MIGPRRLWLSDAQREQIEQARTLAAADAEAIAGFGNASAGNTGAGYAIAYGRTRAAIMVLLDVIDDLTSRAHAALPDDDRLARVAAVLAGLDWERDGTVGLEAIDLIINPPGGVS